MLGEYRLWLDNEGIPAESRSGWPMPEVFEPQNIEAFIIYFTGEPATSEKGPKQPIPESL
jgi:hypothetical protein